MFAEKMEEWFEGIKAEVLKMPMYSIVKLGISNNDIENKYYEQFGALLRKALDNIGREDVVVVAIKESAMSLEVLDKKEMLRLGWMRKDDVNKLLDEILSDDEILKKINGVKNEINEQ